MLGIDITVLVRFLVRDDDLEFQKAHRLIRREVSAGRPVFVLRETEWVLRSRYSLEKNEFLETISGLLASTDVQLEDELAIEEALFVWKDNIAGFADCLIGARNRRLGCTSTATFDAIASKLPGFVVA